MPRGHVFPTDQGWFDFLSAQSPLDEVNFWTPKPWGGRFGILSHGEPLFFKLKAPFNHIGGFGRFAHYTTLPIERAWQTFGPKNGARSLDAMQQNIARLRHAGGDWSASPEIGCIVLVEPSFWPRDLWIPAPTDFKVNSVRGRGYDLVSATGAELWIEAVKRLGSRPSGGTMLREVRTIVPGGFGDPLLRKPRLGQGAFRTIVLDVYRRQCAVTGERALPVLQAAHIRPFSVTEQHNLGDAVLLRSDIHALLDAGYITITPELRIQLSPRFAEEFGTESDYFRLNGTRIQVPHDPAFHPSRAALEWHNTNRFLTV